MEINQELICLHKNKAVSHIVNGNPSYFYSDDFVIAKLQMDTNLLSGSSFEVSKATRSYKRI